MSNIELDVKDLQKVHGDFRLATELPEMDVVSSGSVSLDYVLGIGGIPRGVIVELYGPESIGKTALAYSTIAEHQKVGLNAAFINLEGIFDVDWAKKISDIDTGKLALGEPTPGFDTVALVEDIVHSGKFGLVVVDSIGAMINDQEVRDSKGKPGKIQPGGAAGLVTSMVGRIMSYGRKNGTTTLFINQLRDSFGTIFPQTHTPGGRALKFGASLRIEMKPTKDVVMDGEKVVGKRIVAQIEKSKVSVPYRVKSKDHSPATWMFYNEEFRGVGPGIDRMGEVIDLALKINVIKRGGAFYNHPTFGNSIQGAEGVKEFLRENKDAYEAVRQEIIKFARDKEKDE